MQSLSFIQHRTISPNAANENTPREKPPPVEDFRLFTIAANGFVLGLIGIGVLAYSYHLLH